MPGIIHSFTHKHNTRKRKSTNTTASVLFFLQSATLNSLPPPTRHTDPAVSQLLLSWKGGNSSLKREPLGHGIKLNNATWIKLTKVYLAIARLVCFDWQVPLERLLNTCMSTARGVEGEAGASPSTPPRKHLKQWTMYSNEIIQTTTSL